MTLREIVLEYLAGFNGEPSIRSLEANQVLTRMRKGKELVGTAIYRTGDTGENRLFFKRKAIYLLVEEYMQLNGCTTIDQILDAFL